MTTWRPTGTETVPLRTLVGVTLAASYTDVDAAGFTGSMRVRISRDGDALVVAFESVAARPAAPHYARAELWRFCACVDDTRGDWEIAGDGVLDLHVAEDLEGARARLTGQDVETFGVFGEAP